jgi:DNA-binding CsgD family transcriptional regulator
MQLEVLVLDTKHNIQAATPRAVAWLVQHFGEVKNGTRRLPPLVKAWLEREEAKPAGQAGIGLSASDASVVAAGRGFALVGRVFRGRSIIVLTLEVRRQNLPDAGAGLQPLVDLGVSRREAEVLSWVAEGKRNCEIGVILGLSPRTVQQHLFRAYQKLGVETRTAAAVKVLSILGAEGPTQQPVRGVKRE